MAKLVEKKFIGNKQVDGEKIKLLAGQSIKAEAVSGTEVDLLSVDSAGKVFAMGSEVGKKSEIDQVASDLSAESSRAIGVEASLQAQITQEVSDRTTADANLQSQIDALSGSSGSSLAALEASLTQEIADRIADVNAEESRAMAAESALSSSISQEVSDRQTAVAGVQSQIDAIMQGSSSSLDSFVEVVQAFQAADNNLNGAITALATSASSGLAAEEARAMAAESAIATNLSNEITRATAAEGVLQDNIDNLDGYAQSIRADLDQEIIDRATADSALDARVDVLESVVWFKEKFSIVNGQTSVTLSHIPEASSMSAFVDRLAIHEGASEDYTISGTTMTFLNDLVSPGQSSLGNGDTVYVKYQYKM